MSQMENLLVLVSQSLGRLQLIIMFFNTGAPKTINGPFGTNGKLMILGVPKLEHFRVNPLYCFSCHTETTFMHNFCIKM